jgi:hypothetical protein
MPQPVNVKAVPQAKVRKIQIFRTPEEIRRRELLDFSALSSGLNTIHAISDVLDHTSDLCQGNGKEDRLPTIMAGLGEALKVVHHRMALEIEVE